MGRLQNEITVKGAAIFRQKAEEEFQNPVETLNVTNSISKPVVRLLTEKFPARFNEEPLYKN